jgi:predicted RNA-binding Zn ribbon-like protein
MRMSDKTVADIRLVGGHPALDFTNTVDARGERWGPDFLGAYPDLVVWAQRVELIDAAEASGLLRAAGADAPEARQALDRARRLREALHDVFAAEAGDAKPDPEAERIVTDAVVQASALRVLAAEADGFVWRWRDGGLDAIAHRIAFAAAELLVQRPGRRRLRQCPGPNCGWLFLDTSRGGHRRWCSDQSCGTHARVRRFRARE